MKSAAIAPVADAVIAVDVTVSPFPVAVVADAANVTTDLFKI